MKEVEKGLITGGIAGVVAESFEGVADEIVEDIQARISDQYPPASTPGTPPHRRSGNLQNKTDSLVTTEIAGQEIKMRISNSAFYAGFLRDGTSRMKARDFMNEGDIKRYLPRLIDTVVAAITSKYG